MLCQATLGAGTEYDLVECRGCGTRYLSPLPAPEQLEKLYRPEYYGTDWYKQRGSGMAFAKVTLRNRPPGRFLDVGCGLGFFMDSIRKHAGWEVYGVEFAEAAVAFAREKMGLDVRQGELPDAHFPENFFDYIQIRNVLEHVTDPVGLLKECRRILKPGGTFHLFVPNGLIDSLDLINYSRSEGRAGFSKSGHIFFFPKRALLRMFEEAGFEVERRRTFGIRKGLASLGYWPRFKDEKKYYAPPADDGGGSRRDGRISLPPGKNRPDLYYIYRLIRMNVRMWPGTREYGLDYEFLLKPRS